MDVNAKIRQILTLRGWTAYRLSKESGLSESTVANILKRNTIPSVDTLEAICRGMGVTMSQFFADGDLIEVTPKTREMIDCWTGLSEQQRDAVLNLMKTMNQK